MINRKSWLLVPAVVFAAACGRGDNKALDNGLQTDLSLAAQTQNPQQTISPMEAGYANTPGAAGYNAAPQRYQTVERAPVYRAPRTVRRSSGGYSRGSYGTYPAPAPEPVRHTKRDAGIGAAAGAVIGATTSRDKVKGAIIGAAAGGILGGIIGHTIDVDKNP